MGKARVQQTWGTLQMTTDDGKKHNLSIKDDQLLWDGKPIVTERKVTFGGLVNTAIVFASLSTVAMAIFTVIDLWPW